MRRGPRCRNPRVNVVILMSLRASSLTFSGERGPAAYRLPGCTAQPDAASLCGTRSGSPLSGRSILMLRPPGDRADITARLDVARRLTLDRPAVHDACMGGFKGWLQVISAASVGDC